MDIKSRWGTTTCALFFVALTMALTADSANPGVQMRVTKKGDISWKFTNLLNIPYSYQFSSGQIFAHVSAVIWSRNLVSQSKYSVFKF